MNVACIVHYGTNEQRFIRHCLTGLCKVSDQVIATYCDRFFDGSPEQPELIEQTKKEFPNVRFVGFQWHESSPKYWHQTSRLHGFKALEKDPDYIMFVDADEIVEAERFSEWLKTTNIDAGMLAAYWYFREAQYQAKTWEQPIAILRTEIVRKKMFVGKKERPGMFHLCDGTKQEMVVGTDGKPMFHHYSWVRTKEEMLKKVTTWGHYKRKNWVPLVEEEFSRPFNGKDFVHNYDYLEVEPYVQV